MGFEIRPKNVTVAKTCNWNEINAEDLKNVNHLTIYVDEVEKDVKESINKIIIKIKKYICKNKESKTY